MTDSSTENLAGTMVGPCRVVRRIAMGGMSALYEAVLEPSGQKVALKVIRPEHAGDNDFVRRIAAELQAAQQLAHPNIVRVYTLGALDDGRPWLSMELLDGHSLTEASNRQPLSRAEVVEVLEQVLAALSHAHQHGVIHRDLKPDNLFVVSRSPKLLVKLLDFGLARHAAEPQGAAPQTHNNRGVGTPAYCAPEQALGQPVSPASDLYAFGVLAYELLLGRLPFEPRSPMDVLRDHVYTPVPAPRKVDPDFPPTAERWLLALLAKKPEQRTARAAEALEGLLEVKAALLGQANPKEGRVQPHQARTVAAGDTAGPPPSKPWAKVALGVVLFVAALFLGWALGR